MTGPGCLRRFAPRPHARLRVVCLPHAGASAGAYFPWVRALPSDVELVAVQYPGRADRFAEVPYEEMADLVAEVRDALLGGLEGPYALFGHSMGAAVAYETARALRDAGVREPCRLVVSGRAPVPRTLATGHPPGSEEDALATLRLLGGTPSGLLEDPEARALLLPAFRADLRLMRAYRHTPPDPRLDCPVTALLGADDPLTDAEGAAAWSAVTTGPFASFVLPGGHFYLAQHSREVLARLTA
ncbi:alpha/beta fold hydrolase [Streptomyces sp. NPDC047002]|uniref:thioesterase II family protein n=1 Tax=Streptomyces sp. NPDC047002 TaxID=3155475 RepID=UPI003452B4DF